MNKDIERLAKEEIAVLQNNIPMGEPCKNRRYSKLSLISFNLSM